MKSHNKPCSNCHLTEKQLVHLDCAHSHCLFCLLSDIQANSQQEMLSDELQIQCSICSCVTVLPLSLAYKLVRGTRSNLEVRIREGSKLLCKDCLDELFQMDAYLSGRHKNHKVQSLQKAYPYLQYLSEQTQKSISQHLSHLEVLGEAIKNKKEDLNDSMVINIGKIRMEFSKLQSQISKRERELIEQYQVIMNSQIRGIDQTLRQIMTKIEQGQAYHREISYHRHLQPAYSQKYQLARYLIQNKPIIDEFTNDQRLNLQQKCTLSLKQCRDFLSLEKLNQVIDYIRGLNLLKRTESKEMMLSSLSSDYFDRKRSELFDMHSNVLRKHDRERKKAEQVTKIVQTQPSKVLRMKNPMKMIQRSDG